jgi:AraC-like DNA-binding protein
MTSTRASGEWRLPRIHASHLRLMAVALQRRGVDPDAQLAAQGLSLWPLEDGARLAPLAHIRCLASALPESGGLEIGELSPVTLHGPMGLAMTASATLAEALEVFATYGGARGRIMRFTCREGAGFADLELVERFNFDDLRPFMLEATAVLAVRLMEAVVGGRLAGLALEFPYAAPAWAAAYAGHFSGDVRFDADVLRIRIPAPLLRLRGVAADPIAKEAALRQCAREATEIELSARRDLLPWLWERLSEAEGGFPALERLAQELDLSPRTLIRRLKAKGYRYRDLVDELRAERASWRLIHTDTPIEEIAVALGYADPSNFSRTFQRWRGQRPSEYRRAARGA